MSRDSGPSGALSPSGSSSPSGLPGRREVIAQLLAGLDEPLVVSNLGSNTFDLHAVADSDRHLYLWGGMGLAHSVGLGVALARPERRVLVLDGDGALLMGLGGLATIAAWRPANLLHVVVDNRCYANTGGQPTHTARGVDLAAVAAGCGLSRVFEVPERHELGEALAAFETGGPVFARVLVEETGARPAFRPDPVTVKRRFMASWARWPAGARPGEAHPGGG